jgi:hypothetical protein
VVSWWELLAIWITAISTAATAFFAWTQLRAIKRTAQADFIHRLTTDFVSDKTRAVVQAAYNKEIAFYANNDDPYFTYGQKRGKLESAGTSWTIMCLGRSKTSHP